MDLRDLSRVLRRRWYLAAPLMALTLTASMWIHQSATPHYAATSQVRLVPPPAAARPAAARAANPYLDNLSALVDVVHQSLMGHRVRADLLAAGQSADFAIGFDDSATLVSIEAVAVTPEQATSTTSRLTKLFTQSVTDKQRERGVPYGQFIVVQRLSTADAVRTDDPRGMRGAASLGIGGVLLSLMITIGWDVAARRSLGPTQVRPGGARVRPSEAGPAKPSRPVIGDGGLRGPVVESPAGHHNRPRDPVFVVGDVRLALPAGQAPAGPGPRIEVSTFAAPVDVRYRTSARPAIYTSTSSAIERSDASLPPSDALLPASDSDGAVVAAPSTAPSSLSARTPAPLDDDATVLLPLAHTSWTDRDPATTDLDLRDNNGPL